MVVLGLVACQGDQVPTSPDDSGFRIAAGKGGVKGKPDRSGTTTDATNPDDADLVVTPEEPIDSSLSPEEPVDTSLVEADLKQQYEDERVRLEAAAVSMEKDYDWMSSLWDVSQEWGWGGLLSCEPQKYAYDVAIIGPAGGRLRIGKHTFEVPRGALSEEVVISGEARPNYNVEVEMSPMGLNFATASMLTLSYAHCNADYKENFIIVYVDANGNIVYPVPSKDDKSGRRVHGAIDHFSRYAIAR